MYFALFPRPKASTQPADKLLWAPSRIYTDNYFERNNSKVAESWLCAAYPTVTD
ncbi:hypothetical protein GCM10011585_04540 [Edaphobacter dinghuensis]|uniref:Uncharacterized protein n=1 Tax=Edaphobacter dinghuensis TaxID=1560005 RepID=A0A917LYC9_9BACT|nr:hypothetical protein GCM10011585_04540 [Edaphobacter dinghuensis]